MRRLAALAVLAVLFSSPAHAGSDACPTPDAASFSAWLEGFKQEAAAQGISQSTIATALDGVTYDPKVIGYDRNQKVFRQSFEQFSGRMVNAFRINKGQAMLARYADLLSQIERQLGVPGPVVVAIWGLETDFGANIGRMPTIRSLATLAFDCRRQEHFHAELLDALRIIDRGDMAASAMRGAWAGELGQTQFMASSYVKFALDYDGDGRRDLLRSTPDVLASTANYLRNYGWQAGQSWDPGSANFGVIEQWNKSPVYARTIALLATRIAATQ
jgi:lytic murein transglycosylase